MAPTRNTYSLCSKGLPLKFAENKALDAIEVQVPPNTGIDTSQPLLSIVQLSTALEEQRIVFTRQLSTALEEQKLAFTYQYEALQTEITNLKAEIATSISTQLSNVYVPAPATASSYATVARSSATLPQNSAPTSASRASMSEILYYTIDTLRVDESMQQEVQPGAIRAVIEKEIGTKEGNHWRCAAIIRDPRNSAHIWVACRDEKEQKAVKQAAEKAKVEGTRVLRDQLFPIKVDGVNRCAVLDKHSQLCPKIAEKLGKENKVEIAKLTWLSKKDNQKAYRSIVVYVTKASHASRLLQDQFFHVARESG
jgi:hypothetical protein